MYQNDLAVQHEAIIKRLIAEVEEAAGVCTALPVTMRLLEALEAVRTLRAEIGA